MNIFQALERGLTRPRNFVPSTPTGAKPIPVDLLDQILEAARWSTSAYNTQPWFLQVLTDPDIIQGVSGTFGAYFEKNTNQTWILCHLDRHRMLKVADPLGTEPYIGLGTLCLNVQLAAAALGITCTVWGPSGKGMKSCRTKNISFPDHLEPYYLFKLENDGQCPDDIQLPPLSYRIDTYNNEVTLDNLPPCPENPPEAIECLRLRQTDRAPLLRNDSWPIDRIHILRAAQRALEVHGAGAVQLLSAESEEKTIALTKLQEKAWIQATTDRRRFTETCGWMRFTRREWEHYGDGEFIEHFGLTGIKKSIARLGIKTPLAPLAMSLGVHRFLMRRGEISSETTGAFWTAVLDNANARFETDEHYRREILTGVGAAIQALWLAATGVGASLQFQTSVIVLRKPKNQLRSILKIPGSHEPLFLIRIGYPERDSHYQNIRRPFHQVISRA